MGYNDSHSFYNKKRRIAKAIGSDEKLEDYISHFKATGSED